MTFSNFCNHVIAWQRKRDSAALTPSTPRNSASSCSVVEQTANLTKRKVVTRSSTSLKRRRTIRISVL